jgi:hypothetical protein
MSYQEEEEVEQPQRRDHKKPVSRSLFIPIDDLDLKTADGQDELLRRIQVYLATKDHNNLDLRALTALKDTVKVKTDLSVLRMYQAMQNEFKKWKEAQQTKE